MYFFMCNALSCGADPDDRCLNNENKLIRG